LHIRIENHEIDSDIDMSQASLNNFSIGLTLQNVSASTVNAQDEKFFLDRITNPEEPVRRILKLSQLGVYMNTQEKEFVTETVDCKDMYCREKFEVCDGRMINRYAREHYLLKPIELEVLLVENKPHKVIPQWQLWVRLNKLHISLAKRQYGSLKVLALLLITFNRMLMEKVVHQKAENLKELCLYLSKGESDSKFDKEAFEEKYKTICKQLLSRFTSHHSTTLIENRNDQ